MILFLALPTPPGDGVRTLVLFVDPYRRRQIQMLAMYW
jgi:hypothetical protein